MAQQFQMAPENTDLSEIHTVAECGPNLMNLMTFSSLYFPFRLHFLLSCTHALLRTPHLTISICNIERFQ